MVFLYNDLHIIWKPRNVKIYENSIFVNYWTKYVKWDIEHSVYIDIIYIFPGLTGNFPGGSDWNVLFFPVQLGNMRAVTGGWSGFLENRVLIPALVAIY